ncbi:DUF541 domain-containing protein [Candidatus Parcubacteria bacterium]|nr:MAG: DUF541 domain-containing protein [Candidatus Parcubacteria bacterium]
MNSDKARSYFWVILNILLAAMAVNLVFFVMPAIQRYSESFYPTRVLSVSAEGRTFVTPDLAQVSFSVVSKGLNPEQLADNNNQKVNAAIEFLKSEGIEAKDIKTTGYDLQPDYRYDPNIERRFITGYTLTQTVGVKIRDLLNVAKVIGGLTPLGVNQIGGVTFTIDDPESALADARKDAFARAKAKAEAMAREGGVRLGRVLNVGEFSGPPPIPYYGAEKFGLGGDRAIPAVAAPTIEPGTQEVTVQVSISYALD